MTKRTKVIQFMRDVAPGTADVEFFRLPDENKYTLRIQKGDVANDIKMGREELAQSCGYLDEKLENIGVNLATLHFAGDSLIEVYATKTVIEHMFKSFMDAYNTLGSENDKR